jgi:hypothetical protein
VDGETLEGTAVADGAVNILPKEAGTQHNLHMTSVEQRRTSVRKSKLKMSSNAVTDENELTERKASRETGGHRQSNVTVKKSGEKRQRTSGAAERRSSQFGAEQRTTEMRTAERKKELRRRESVALSEAAA